MFRLQTPILRRKLADCWSMSVSFNWRHICGNRHWCFPIAICSKVQTFCAFLMLFHHTHWLSIICGEYCIAGNIRGRKPQHFSYKWQFPWNLWIAVPVVIMSPLKFYGDYGSQVSPSKVIFHMVLYFDRNCHVCRCTHQTNTYPTYCGMYYF